MEQQGVKSRIAEKHLGARSRRRIFVHDDADIFLDPPEYRHRQGSVSVAYTFDMTLPPGRVNVAIQKKIALTEKEIAVIAPNMPSNLGINEL